MTGRLAALLVAVLVSGMVAADPAAAGEDSPWPRTNGLRPNIRAARAEINKLERQVELMELSVARYDDWETCLTYVPVSEYGDPWNATFGYLYDERDGTQVGFMDGLAVDRRSRPGKEDFMFIDLAREGCAGSDPTQPGGTAEPASVRRAHRQRYKGRRSLRQQLRRLEWRAENLFHRAQVLETASERFDEWESCVSWVPVTQQGDADRTFGYLFGTVGLEPSYMPALHVDRSDWDDPDYMFLALVGGDRPGRTCQDEPGEAVD